MKLFSEKYFTQFESEKIKKIITEVNSYDSLDEPLDVEVASISEEFQFRPLKLETSTYTKDISILAVPVDINRGENSITGKKNIAVVEYCYNITSHFNEKQKELLTVQPLSYADTKVNVILGGYQVRELKFVIPTRYATIDLPDDIIEEVVKQRNSVLEAIQANVSNLNENLKSLNQKIYNTVLECTKARKEYLDKVKNVKSKL